MDGLQYFSKGDYPSKKAIGEAINLLVSKGHKREEAKIIVRDNFLRLYNDPNIIITVEKLCKTI